MFAVLFEHRNRLRNEVSILNNLLYEVNGQIAEITINRPQVLNALNNQVLKELLELLNDISRNTDIRVLIITGAGTKAFIAGADIGEMQDYSVFEAKNFSKLGQLVYSTIEKIDQVTIAAVNGFALGGGCELSLACDIRFASENAKFALPEVKLGIIPGFGGTQRLPRIVGKGIAKELIFSGEMINSQEAYRIGLVNKVYAQEELLIKSREYAEKVCNNGPSAVTLAKSAIYNGLNMDLETACNYEAELFSQCFTTEDQKEGIKAFLEKRKPIFKGK